MKDLMAMYIYYIMLFLVSNCFRMISSHKVEVNGANLHYLKAGVGNHHVLLLPGALGKHFACKIEYCRMTGERRSLPYNR